MSTTISSNSIEFTNGVNIETISLNSSGQIDTNSAIISYQYLQAPSLNMYPGDALSGVAGTLTVDASGNLIYTAPGGTITTIAPGP